jgi:hypothetical protein
MNDVYLFGHTKHLHGPKDTTKYWNSLFIACPNNVFIFDVYLTNLKKSRETKIFGDNQWNSTL